VGGLRTAGARCGGLFALRQGGAARRAECDARIDALAAAVQRRGAILEDNASAEPQTDPLIAEALTAIADAQARLGEKVDAAASRETEAEGGMRLRSIDLALARVLEEISAGRQEATAELRMDLARLTRAVMVASGQDPAADPGAGAR